MNQLTVRDNGHVFSPGLDLIRNYLISTGWLFGSEDGRTSLWHLDEAEHAGVQIALPAREDFRDYAEVVGKALRVLAFVERRPIAEVTGDLSLGGADTVAIKLTPEAPPGEAPLVLAVAAMGALRNLVVASASAVIDGRGLVLPIRRPQRAEAFANQARLSTQPGSFVLSLALPLHDEPAGEPAPGTESDEPGDGALFSSDLLPRPSPFGRRVTDRIVSSVQAAQSLAERVNAGDLPLKAFGESRASAANATELAALAGLGGPDHDVYRVRISRSPLAGGRREPVLLSVTPGQQRVFADAADFLRTRQPRTGVTVHGLVVRLFREGTGGTGPGEVVVQGADDDSGAVRRFRVELTADDYREAVRAHARGLQVVVRGDIDIRGNRRSLRRLVAFDVVAGLDED